MIAHLAFNPSARAAVWTFFQDRKAFFGARYESGFLLSHLVKSITENFTTEESAQEIEQFFKTNPFPGTERSVQQSIETIRLNKPKLPVIATAVENVSHKILSEAAGFDVRGLDLLVGGPPCQAFSVFGQRRGLRDGRGRLIFEFQRLVKEVRPKTFFGKCSGASLDAIGHKRCSTRKR